LNWRCYIMIETLQNINSSYFECVKSIFIIFNSIQVNIVRNY